MVKYIQCPDRIVDPAVVPDQHGARPAISQMVQKTNVSNSNIQKQLLAENEQKSKIKSQEWAKVISDKKLLITIIFGQCNDATRTKSALSTNYETNCDAGNLINFLTRLQTVCYESNDPGLSYKPYKMDVAMKSLPNFSNSKPNDPYAFKEELKIKFGAVSAIVRKFLNGTGVLEHLLKAETSPQGLGDYCTMNVVDRLVWEEKADALNKAMFLLMNSKNDNAKKNLRLAYSQGNKLAYPLNVESTARYVSLMYNIKSANNACNKKGDKNGMKGDEPKSKDKDNCNTSTAGAQVGETATPQDSNTLSDGSSIGAHVSKVAKPNTRLTQSVQDMLATNAINNPI